MVAEMITKIGIPADAELFLRVIVASILGYMIGYERKNRDKSAGMRTHAIVALGAALMMVVSKYGFYDVEKVDSSRVAAQIVSGVGFLGAGVIFVRLQQRDFGLQLVWEWQWEPENMALVSAPVSW